jgi:hypothetical protein
MSTQQEQIIAAWEGAKKALLPAVVSDLQINADHIRHHMNRNQLAWTADNIVSTVWSLRGTILWDKDPVEQTASQKEIERAKKLEAKMRKDYLDSIKDRSIEQKEKNNAADAQDAAKIAEEKETKTLRSQIFRKIDSYFVGHHSGLGRDYSRTESGQDKLRHVLASVVGGRASDGLDKLLARVTNVQVAKTALAAVDDASYKLP